MIADILHGVAKMDSEDEHPYYPRPSMAGPARCIRSMVYHRLNFPREPLSGRAITIFSDSSWHEDLTVDWIRKSAFQIHSEQLNVTCFTVLGEPRTGSIDGIVTDLKGVDRVFEHKAINHFTFVRYLDAKEIPVDYVTQTCCYILGTNKLNPDINEGILLIKNKNSSAYLEYIIHYNIKKDLCTIKELTDSNGNTTKLDLKVPNIITDAVRKFEMVEEYASKKTMPTRPYEMSDWQCEYCSWGKVCWKGYEKEFGKLATGIELEGDIVDESKYYLEVNMHRKRTEKEEDELKAKIKKRLREKGVREARAGNYTYKLTMQHKTSVDKSLIPPHILKKATKTTVSEMLTIREIRKKPDKKKKSRKKIT